MLGYLMQVTAAENTMSKFHIDSEKLLNWGPYTGDLQNNWFFPEQKPRIIYTQTEASWSRG